MRPLSQGASRRSITLVDRRARAHGGARRGSATARIASLIGAIVAGGAASRFGGEPKGLEKVGGERIVDRVERALDAVTRRVLTITRDVRPERGSLVGIHSALAMAQEDVLVVAWDMPFVTPKLLDIICNKLTGPVYAAVPETDDGLQPLCAAYSHRCLPLVEAAIDAGNLRVTDFIDSLPVVHRIGVAELAAAGDPRRLFFNVNTPADLEEAERMARGT